MSRFRSAPSQGDLERLQRIYGCVLKTKHYSAMCRTEEPDYSYVPCWKNPRPFSNVHFRNTTKICSTSPCSYLFVIFTFEPLSQTEIFSNYELFMYFCFCFFFHSYGSFNHANSTSLSFSELSELFTSTLLLSQLIESHFALSSARCHF